MNVLLQITLTVITICLITFLIAVVGYLVTYMRSGENFRKKNVKPSIIDKMLFYERNPFAWRIGFTYSLLGYNQDQIDEFNKALYQVITAESKVFMKSRSGKFKYLVRRLLQGKSSFSQIERYKDTLTSHSVLNEIDPKESLDYILFLEVDRFLNSTVEKLKREQRELPPERPPF
tara:strand:+ start:140 stop:664 length:525 start_codon:yes stop_codon:yes gene_type:complete